MLFDVLSQAEFALGSVALCFVGLVVVAGVVALAQQDGDELGSGGEVGAGFAG